MAIIIIIFAKTLRSCGSLITLMMEAVRTSETSLYFNETIWPYIPDTCHLNIEPAAGDDADLASYTSDYHNLSHWN
jgi:hypothetical protein